ncbi:DUF4405 domain-containing protein [Thermococcus thioreducens]|uniref:HTH cro/C1-type domain-containing protein n=1 Tax=Thermococcus thioreducens TaxID=277988 RepID=A0A0Q2MRX8_9EURY|nr:DUF4405 domain-containing protein [Thermococcus thioreducens]ASJ12536.1 hypothetical protein A3L14_06360 [Thermococcus thioreducens]KQH82463.1 hypothetical protein AMR53_05880 [Thermococcus thioreducens]SEV89186.1 protein of unknown function [Thermococcus thioreducens]
MARWTAPAWLRGTIDLVLTIVFVILAVSGIALYLAPSGRIADTIGWTFLGLDKDTWTNVHTYMGFAMIGLIAAHLIIGFRSMLTMLRMGFRQSRWKPAVAFLLTMGLVLGGFQAYKAYFTEEDSTESTDYVAYLPSETNDTTYTYVEITGSMLKTYTLQQLADIYGVSADELAEVLKEDYGIEAKTDELLEVIEANNGLDREVFKEELASAIEKLLGISNAETNTTSETAEGGES